MHFKKLKKGIRKSIEDRVMELILGRDSPHKIALCFAVGLFTGFLPLFCLQLIPLFIIVQLFKLNKAAITAGHLLINTFTFPFIYFFSFLLGVKILGSDLTILVNQISFGFLWHNFWLIYKPLCAGLFITGTISSIASYFVVKSLVRAYRKKHKVA